MKVCGQVLLYNAVKNYDSALQTDIQASGMILYEPGLAENIRAVSITYLYPKDFSVIGLWPPISIIAVPTI